MAHAASTALPPRSKIMAPAVAASGLPVTAIQCLPCSAGFWVRVAAGAVPALSARRMAAQAPRARRPARLRPGFLFMNFPWARTFREQSIGQVADCARRHKRSSSCAFLTTPASRTYTATHFSGAAGLATRPQVRRPRAACRITHRCAETVHGARVQGGGSATLLEVCGVKCEPVGIFYRGSRRRRPGAHRRVGDAAAAARHARMARAVRRDTHRRLRAVADDRTGARPGFPAHHGRQPRSPAQPRLYPGRAARQALRGSVPGRGHGGRCPRAPRSGFKLACAG